MRIIKKYKLFESSKLSENSNYISKEHIDEISDIILDLEYLNLHKQEFNEYIDSFGWHNVDSYTTKAYSVSFKIEPTEGRFISMDEVSTFIEVMNRFNSYYEMYMENELVYGFNIHYTALEKSGNHRIEGISINSISDLLEEKRLVVLESCIFRD